MALLFIQIPLSSAVFRARLQIGEKTDRRLNLVNKLIQGIQTIKTYVWEEPIISKIQKARRAECRRFLTLYWWKGVSEGITKNTNLLLALPILLLPLARGKPLIASTIFPALGLADSLTEIVVKNLNYGINAAAIYYSVILRVEEVLLIPEKE